MADVIAFEIRPDKEDLLDLKKAIDRMGAETRRSIHDSITLAGVKVAQSGRAASRLGKRKRKVVANPEYRQAKGSFAWARRQQRQGKAIPAEAQQALNELATIAPLLILRLSQGGVFKLPTWSRDDFRRDIPDFIPGGLGGRGLAKVTFGVMAAKMAAAKGKERFSSKGSQYRVSKYQERYGKNSGAIVARLVNQLSYLNKAYPGIASMIVRKGTAALNGQLDRKIKSAADRANKGGQ